jgi:hypothetical protein
MFYGAKKSKKKQYVDLYLLKFNYIFFFDHLHILLLHKTHSIVSVLLCIINKILEKNIFKEKKKMN